MKQIVDLKEGMTCVVKGGKLVVETPEWKPKEGDVVTNQGDGAIFIQKSPYGYGTSFYAALYDGEFYTNGNVRYKSPRLATREERCTFFARLVAEGYKWNAKKLKLNKVEKKWSPVDGEFVYYAEGDKTNEGVSIYKDVDCSYASILVRSGRLEAFTAPVLCSKPSRQATDSERKQLIDALAKEGKMWNAELKRVEPIQPKVVEMTMEQVCEKLGMNVKIVKK